MIRFIHFHGRKGFTPQWNLLNKLHHSSRFTQSHSTASNIYSASGVQACPDSGTLDSLKMSPRHSARLVFGPMLTDEQILTTLTPRSDDLAKLRQEAERCIAGARFARKAASPVIKKALPSIGVPAPVAITTFAEAFVETAHAALRWMEDLPEHHIYHWPRKFGFWRGDAPAAYAMNRALHTAFDRITSDLHNGAGLAIEGPRGVGKSHLLRAVLLVTSLLAPQHVVGCYVDYKLCAAYTPGSFLRVALANAPASAFLSSALADFEAAVAPDVHKSIALAPVLGSIIRSGRTPIFFADEISNVYLQPTVWNELHDLASRTNTFMMVADHGWKLRAMLQRTDESALRRYISSSSTVHQPGKYWELPQSLNDDKLQVTRILPFTRPEEYRAYLKQCSYIIRSSEPADAYRADAASAEAYTPAKPLTSHDVPRALIDSMHLHTGGRLGAMDRIKSDLEFHTCGLPPADSAAYHVLCQLTNAQLNFEVDPFNMVAVPPETIEEWLADYHAGRHIHSGDANYVDLYSLLDQNIIAVHPRVADRYTFSTPVDYFRMHTQRPHVWLSHAWADKDHPLFTKFRHALQQKGVTVVDCHTSGAKDAMVKAGVKKLEVLQAAISKNDTVVFFASRNFMARLNDTSSGLRDELTATAAAKKADSRANTLVVTLEPSRNGDNWCANELIRGVQADACWLHLTENDEFENAVVAACWMGIPASDRVKTALQMSVGKNPSDSARLHNSAVRR